MKQESQYHDRSQEDVEVAMKGAAVAVSSAAVVLMFGGLLAFLTAHGLGSWPGVSVAPLGGFLHQRRIDKPLLAMSAGIVLLGLLPALRVVLAFGIYARRRKIIDAVIALIVLLELIVSMLGIGT